MLGEMELCGIMGMMEIEKEMVLDVKLERHLGKMSLGI